MNRRFDSKLNVTGAFRKNFTSIFSLNNFLNYGRGRGIRTPAPLSRPLGFQDRPLQPDLGIPP